MTETAPLSPQQRELIDNACRHPGAATKYHGVSVFHLEGEVCEEALNAAFADLIARHPALRTVVSEVDGERWQIVRPVPSVPLAEEKYDDRSAEDLCGRMLDERYGMAEVLAGRPLFDARLQRRPFGTFLTVRIHHLVFDGTSLLIIWRDLGACYAARLRGHAAALPEVRTTATGYARRMAAVSDAGRAAAVDFYRPLLGSGDGRLHWPPPAVPYAGSATDVGEVTFVLDRDRAGAVRQLSRRHRVSPFLALASVTAKAVAEICAAEEVLIGVDTANRDAVGEEVVGFFLNTKLLCATGAAARPVDAVIAQLRRPWLDSAAHGHVYYDVVLDGLGKTGLMKVNMPSQSRDWSMWEQPLDLDGLIVTEQPAPVSRNSWRDVSVQWVIEGDSYRCLAIYRYAGVDEATVQVFLDRVVALLSDVVPAEDASA